MNSKNINVGLVGSKITKLIHESVLYENEGIDGLVQLLKTGEKSNIDLAFTIAKSNNLEKDFFEWINSYYNFFLPLVSGNTMYEKMLNFFNGVFISGQEAIQRGIINVNYSHQSKDYVMDALTWDDAVVYGIPYFFYDGNSRLSKNFNVVAFTSYIEDDSDDYEAMDEWEYKFLTGNLKGKYEDYTYGNMTKTDELGYYIEIPEAEMQKLKI